MEDIPSIYLMKLHDLANSWVVKRVPGGWIYSEYQDFFTAVFVPYNEEFKPKTQ